MPAALDAAGEELLAEVIAAGSPIPSGQLNDLAARVSAVNGEAVPAKMAMKRSFISNWVADHSDGDASAAAAAPAPAPVTNTPPGARPPNAPIDRKDVVLALRGYLYKRINQHYCLIDFCYASNACCLVQLLAYPTSSRLFHANFLLTTGPLAMAVPTWRNSLVFHSLDRVTSSYVHVLPPLLTLCLRWFPPEGLHVPPTLPLGETMVHALLFYGGWQAFYLLYTECLFPPKQSLDTSIRILARREGVARHVVGSFTLSMASTSTWRMRRIPRVATTRCRRERGARTAASATL